jgi:FtsH-binding integral membrane protein
MFTCLQWDFSGMAPFLFGGILALIVAGMVGTFFPFSKTMDLVYGIGGSLLFSAYIVFDVSMHCSCIGHPLNLYIDLQHQQATLSG